MSKQQIEGSILIGFLIVGAIGIIGWTLPGTARFGQWKSFSALDTELFNNATNHRVVYNPFFQIFEIGFMLRVNCVTPSNTVGAKLRLQSATYAIATRTNTTLFADVGPSVLVDNSANNPCPGTLLSGNPTFLTAVTGNGFSPKIFRILGSGGGGSGDNPVFSGITLVVNVKAFNLENTYATSRTTTGFTATVTETFSPQAAQTISFGWIASNSTLAGVGTQDGSGSCTIALGLFSCTQAQTFGIAFAATPNVVITPYSVDNSILQMPVSEYSFMQGEDNG